MIQDRMNGSGHPKSMCILSVTTFEFIDTIPEILKQHINIVSRVGRKGLFHEIENVTESVDREPEFGKGIHHSHCKS